MFFSSFFWGFILFLHCNFPFVFVHFPTIFFFLQLVQYPLLAFLSSSPFFFFGRYIYISFIYIWSSSPFLLGWVYQPRDRCESSIRLTTTKIQIPNTKSTSLSSNNDQKEKNQTIPNTFLSLPLSLSLTLSLCLSLPLPLSLSLSMFLSDMPLVICFFFFTPWPS